jgi:hypothetical protein
MSKIERAFGAIIIVIIEIFLVPMLLPILGSSAWILIIFAILFPILIAWKGDVLKEIDYGG